MAILKMLLHERLYVSKKKRKVKSGFRTEAILRGGQSVFEAHGGFRTDRSKTPFGFRTEAIRRGSQSVFTRMRFYANDRYFAPNAEEAPPLGAGSDAPGSDIAAFYTPYCECLLGIRGRT